MERCFLFEKKKGGLVSKSGWEFIGWKGKPFWGGGGEGRAGGLTGEAESGAMASTKKGDLSRRA